MHNAPHDGIQKKGPVREEGPSPTVDFERATVVFIPSPSPEDAWRLMPLCASERSTFGSGHIPQAPVTMHNAATARSTTLACPQPRHTVRPLLTLSPSIAPLFSIFPLDPGIKIIMK